MLQLFKDLGVYRVKKTTRIGVVGKLFPQKEEMRDIFLENSNAG
jgi:hypothetical protein